MIDGALTAAVVVAALGSALSGGAMYAFSSFVMPGLARLPNPAGVAAMQAINVAAPTPSLVVPMFGNVPLCLVLGVVAATQLDEAGAGWLLAGSALHLVGAGVTAAYHVPRNDALDRVDADSAEGSALWERYQREWTRGNHVRSAAFAAAVVAFSLALHAG